MKIAILTLPFRTNYGQILQGYALQTVLSRMGHEVEMLDDPYFTWDYYLRYPLMCMKRAYEKYLMHKKDIEIFVPEHIRIKHHTQRFIDNHIQRRVVRKWDARLASEYDAFIVGSDQVWRPQYFISKNRPSIDIAYLSFTEGERLKRIAYAASFGTDECEYTMEQLQECRRLVKMFDSVSVREQSGVTICKDFFDINATQVVDPTLLLTVNDYISLIPKNCPKSKGDLLVYILDESELVNKYIRQLSHHKGLTPFSVNAKKIGEGVSLSECIKPSVEEWLQGFIDAKFIVTDSFHACVFSIIFNKPFIVLTNNERGLTRIKSLLNMFGLSNHLITDYAQPNIGVPFDVDWNRINNIMIEESKKAEAFLEKIGT